MNRPYKIAFALTYLTISSVMTIGQVKMKPEMTETWEPAVEVVLPSAGYIGAKPPSDAVVLFEGKSAGSWMNGKGMDAEWQVKEGVLTVKKGTGDIQTREQFGDIQMHIEWKIPKSISGAGQSRGNSGIFFQGRYELQILDSYQNATYTNGQAASIYKQSPPLKNAMNPPGEWNVYDVIYTAPRFNTNGSLFSPARITVLHNGVLVQNNFEIKGPTEYIGLPKYSSHGDGPIILQDHGDPSEAISFRNIWVRRL